MSKQKQQSAIRITGQGTAAVLQVPVPDIRPDQVLVRTVAVAHNPSDWMILDWSPNVGATVGCDYAGVVVEVGGDVRGFEVGERVAGFSHGGEFRCPRGRAPLTLPFFAAWKGCGGLGDAVYQF